MPVGVNPLNTAASVLAYGTDGTNFTDFTGYIENVEPSGRMRKVINRLLLGGTTVVKWVARLDHGDLKVTLEYSSAIYAIIDALFVAKTRWYNKLTMDDTGGTNGSKHVFDGYLKELSGPPAPGDDKTATFTYTLAVNTYTFTAAA